MRHLPLILLALIYATQAPAKTQQWISSGTGFVINTSGHIITNNHVVDHDCNHLEILTPVGKKTAKVIARDAKQDLAVLQAPYTPVRYAPMRWNIANLAVGESTSIIGYPGAAGARGIEHVAQSEVIGLQGPSGEPDWIHLTTAANHGNSGGPVLDSKGNVIGVITANIYQYKTDAQGKPVGNPISKTDAAITLNALKNFLNKHGVRFYKSTSKGGAYTDATLHSRTHHSIIPVLCYHSKTKAP